MGDFNARLIYPSTAEEEEIMGKHTMHCNSEGLERLTETMRDNRDLMTELCMTNEMRVMNTMYRKPKQKTATYRIIKSTPEEGHQETVEAGTHEQIDYILTMRRWSNTVTNAESDTCANINTDHYPVVVDIRIRLRKIEKGGEGRKRYKQCSPEQRQAVQNAIEKTREKDNANRKDERTKSEEPEEMTQRVKRILKAELQEMPEEAKRDKHRKVLVFLSTISNAQTTTRNYLCTACIINDRWLDRS